MLYTFSKGDRFPKRRIIMYEHNNNEGVINFMMSKRIYMQEQHHWGLAISMTSRKSKKSLYLECQNHHHLMFIT